MKKIALLILAGTVALTIAGCTANTAVTTESGTSEPSVTSGAVIESAGTTESAEKEETAEVTTAAVVSDAEATDTVANESTDNSNPAQSAASNPQRPTPPASNTPLPQIETPPPTESPKPTIPPATTPPTPEPTPTPTEPPKPKTAYDAPYDTATIIADAKSYGESIGMTWSEPLTVDNCSWEAPGTTSATLSGERLKTAIEGRIARIKKLQTDNGYQLGEFHFKVLLIPNGSEYTIYFLMG
jgi:hypothetical protein